jgi:hypothetical protein
MKAPISAIIAIVTGLLVLIGYFIPIEPLISLRTILLQWAVILPGFALIVGVINLIKVHGTKIRAGKVQAVLLFVGEIPALNLIRSIIIEVPAVAGARGILLGVALGTIATGMRVLIGADKPYGG